MIKLNKDFLMGAAVGFGAGFFTASSGLFQRGQYKDSMKQMMKAGLVGFENIRDTVVSFAETAEDLFAEARAELREEHAGQAKSANPAASDTSSTPPLNVETHSDESPKKSKSH